MTDCDIVLGRFQPFHNGHLAAVRGMKNKPVIAVVHGKKSAEKNNPLPVKQQLNMIRRVVPDACIFHAENGYVPDIIVKVKTDFDLDVRTIVCGADRIKEYQAQIDRANKTLDGKIVVEFKEAERITSGSEVREAIRSGDKRAFKANVPKQLWDEFTNLTEQMRG